jgi:LemA protein
MMAVWFSGCVAIALVAFLVVTFNDLIAARNRVRTAWSNIDVQLQRRHDLVPQLTAVVKGYADHERSTLESIAALRTRAQAGGSVATRSAIEAELGSGLARLLAIQERYPELKASANFLDLQRQLVAVEDTLQSARSGYNETVRVYNTQIQQFPDGLLARPFGFAALEFFQAEDTSAIKL